MIPIMPSTKIAQKFQFAPPNKMAHVLKKEKIFKQNLPLNCWPRFKIIFIKASTKIASGTKWPPEPKIEQKIK